LYNDYNLKGEQMKNETKTFEEIKQIDENGSEFWYARELQITLQYKEWRNFNKVIDTAQVACKISKHKVDEHFVEVNKPIISGKGRAQNVLDYRLTRYACYLIVMNGDPRKKVIAEGQTYFAVKTRQQELSEIYSLLNEDERRLFIRGDVKQKNMLLADAAKNAGIITSLEYAVFQDAGYKGLYNGLTAADILTRKNLTAKEEILDYMGSEELGANLFRITQTEAVMKKNEVSTPAAANATHFRVGSTIRKTIRELGGTMPEELPTPEKSIRQIETEAKKQIEHKKKK
jgi:DNA-damage-inducible protein D